MFDSGEAFLAIASQMLYTFFFVLLLVGVLDIIFIPMLKEIYLKLEELGRKE